MSEIQISNFEVGKSDKSGKQHFKATVHGLAKSFCELSVFFFFCGHSKVMNCFMQRSCVKSKFLGCLYMSRQLLACDTEMV